MVASWGMLVLGADRSTEERDCQRICLDEERPAGFSVIIEASKMD